VTVAAPSILQAIDSPELWRSWFRDPATWEPWRAFLKALFGLPLSDIDRDLFHACTGRAEAPGHGFREAWLICGRRAGKSFVLALVACFLAVFRDWRPHLSPGEVGYIKILAVDRRQARVIHRYCRALLTEVPAIAELVVEDSVDQLVLSNGVTIEIQTASFRSVRGFTVIAALCDEIAFWRSDESANPDSEIIAALRPAMATIPNAIFLAASSPYAKRGELYHAFRRYFGRDDAPALIWRAATRTMNPTVPQQVVDDAIARDPDYAEAEFLAQFRSDIENFISREIVESLIVPNRFELPPLPSTKYAAFVDPSGGSQDAMTLAIAHSEGGSVTGSVILDVLREHRPPFDPDAVCRDFADTLRPYRIGRVTGDRYGGVWPAERFAAHGISYDPCERPKSDLYRELLPLLNGGRVELLDNPRLVAQLCSLERRTARGGRDSIDHPPGGHDDLINAAAGCITTAFKPLSGHLWRIDEHMAVVA
jgi:hypothetical protein